MADNTKRAVQQATGVDVKFWPFPLLRNYHTCPQVDNAVRLVMSQPDLRFLSGDGYYETYASSGGELTFWAGNRFYAYASQGVFKARHGTTFPWMNGMPSRSTVRWMQSRRASAIATAEQPIKGGPAE